VGEPFATRRDFLVGGALIATDCALAQPDDVAAIRDVERELRGLVGFGALDTGSGRSIAHRSGERFALCSTFKVPLAAAVLARIDAGAIAGGRMLRVERAELLSVSPVSAAHADAGTMPVLTACEAVVSHSDNTAANLLLELIGGPSALTSFLRGLGDDVTRLDRYELELNSNVAGDPRDTTTPEAMLRNLQALLLADALGARSRELLTAWMVAEQRGKARIRAGLPAAWRVANKPGTSTNGATNDIAVAWPRDHAPIIVAAYINAPEATAPARETAIAEIARAVAQSFGLA
jgi:beta-lactamase class A